MNTNALTLTLFGVTLLDISLDQIEGWIIALLAGIAHYLQTHGVISGAQETAALALLGLWLHRFLRQDTTGLVTRLAGFIRKRLPAKQPAVPPAATLLLVAVIPLALMQYGCTTLNNAAASVPPSTVQHAATFVRNETQDAVAAYVAHHPNSKGDFEMAARALDTFIAAGNTDPNALRTAILADIPAADRADFAPIVDAAAGAYALYASAWVTKETSGAFATDAKILLGAIDDGLTAGIVPSGY